MSAVLNNLYLFDSVLVNHPYLKYERYDYLDNLQMMFGEKGSNIKTVSADAEKFNLVIEIARYVKILAKNFFQSYYKINRLAIVNGDLAFTDYSLREKFALHLSPMDIWADSIDKDRSWAKLYLKSGFKPYGAVSMDLKINPKDSGDFNINYALQKFPLTVFNPYVITYTSFPLDRGTIEMKGDWSVRNGMIQSENNLLIIDPRITSRLHNKDANYLPLPLIMALVRERGNVIDYEIPITGNLRDPKFHLKDVIFDLLKNIFIKPPTTPYRLQVKSIETEIEKFHSLQWGMTTTSLSNQQVRYVEKITDFLAENPTASISVQPILYSAKEKEYLLFFEAKKKYYLFINNNSKGELNNSDSLKVEKISVKDSMFVKFLDSRVKDSLLFTVQDKCLKLIDPSEINKAFNQLADNRKNYFIQFFEKRNVHNRVQFLSSESTVPYNGFSLYKIMYKGDYPKSLLKAYEKMNDLDSEAPRKKFRKVRYERT